MKVEVRKIANGYVLRWWEPVKPHGMREVEMAESCMAGVELRLREVFGLPIPVVDDD